MSDETPQSDDNPTVPSTPAEPAATEPPAPVTPEPAAPPAASDVPTEATAPVAAPAAAAPAAAAAPVAAAPAESRSGFFVPKWLAVVAAAIIAALVFGGIGYAIGDSNGGSDSVSQRAIPGLGNGSNTPRTLPGNGPLGRNGNGNNGNGNGNGNGNSGGAQTSNTAFLGVGIADGTNGAQVTAVKSGSPADQAGLKTGDLITAVDGTSIASAADLAQAVHSHSSGDQITITYTRNGTSATAKATLSTNSNSQSS